MRVGPSHSGKRRRDALAEDARTHWLFFRQWMRAPLTTASVVPSSRILGDAMAEALAPDAHHVIELGPGTGVFTRALLRHGIKPDELLVVELNPEMVARLLKQMPGVHIVEADAQRLVNLVADFPGFGVGEVDAVVSGLGFLSMPDAIVSNIVTACFDVMRPTGQLILFTYGPRAPIPRSVLRTLKLKSKRVNFVWRNLPPASVYVLSKRQ